jgi:hypothetical protein
MASTNKEELEEKAQLERTFTFTYLPDTMLKDDRLTSYDILTAMGIAFYVDKNRVSWPGKKAIAKIARISERKVQECIKSLEEHGYLSVERRKDPNKEKMNYTNKYLLHDVPQVKVEGGAQHAPGVGHSVLQGGAQHAPEQDTENNNHSNNKDAAAKEGIEEAMEYLTTRGVSDNSYSRKQASAALDAGLSPAEIDDFFAYLLSLADGKDNRSGYALALLADGTRLNEWRAAQQPANDIHPAHIMIMRRQEEEEDPASEEEALHHFRALKQRLNSRAAGS